MRRGHSAEAGTERRGRRAGRGLRARSVFGPSAFRARTRACDGPPRRADVRKRPMDCALADRKLASGERLAQVHGRAHITAPSTAQPCAAIARMVESLVLKRWLESLRGKPLLYARCTCR